VPSYSNKHLIPLLLLLLPLCLAELLQLAGLLLMVGLLLTKLLLEVQLLLIRLLKNYFRGAAVTAA
jgi:hypothetical protein